jgi:peroxiredoxin
MTVPFYLSYVALWLIVAFQSLILLGLVRAHAAHRDDWADLPSLEDDLTGQLVPDFSAIEIGGTPIDQTAVVGQRTALLFVSPRCRTCATTLDELRALQTKSEGRVIVICRASQEECQELVSMYGFDSPVVVDADGAVSSRFGVNGTPVAVLVAKDGHIETHGSPMRSGELKQLISDGGGPS